MLFPYFFYLRVTPEFKHAIQNDINPTKILFDISGSKADTQKLTAESLSLYIGPEGGFTDQELKLAKDLPAEVGNNFQIVSLGNLTLRAETASIIASYLAIQS